MKLFFILLSFMTSFSLYAQDGDDDPVILREKVSLGNSIAEFIFTYIEKCPEETKNQNHVLMVGQNSSLYVDYDTYRLDSCMESQPQKQWTNAEYDELCYEYGTGNSFKNIFKDRHSNKLTYRSHVCLDYYQYEDSVSFDWKIESDKMEVCGYPCRKATCEFRGRKWTVWFTKKIAISDGPWKFSGLPGMILRAEDENKEQIFYATSVRKGGSKMSVRKIDYMKTTREKFNKAEKNYYDNPGSFWNFSALIGKDENGNVIEPSGSIPFNPLELK